MVERKVWHVGVPHDVRVSICVAESLGQLQTVAWTVNTLPRHHLHMQRWCAHSHAHAQQRYLLSSPEKKSYSAQPQVPSELASVQTEAPAAEYVPAGQLLQVEAPEASENLPAVQLVQTVEALAAEYLPASHSSQAMLTPAVALYFPATQLVQAVAPEVGEYVPAKHQRVLSLRESCTCCV